MMNWHREAALLSRSSELKRIMDENIERFPEFYERRMQLLNEFFAAHPKPLDIAFILYGALADAHILAYHLEGNNLLFYRPKASHKRVVDESFLFGRPINSEGTLLLFDSDMVTGNAMAETADYFIKWGYDRARIFGYLDLGCKRRGNIPELMHIDDLLKKE